MRTEPNGGSFRERDIVLVIMIATVILIAVIDRMVDLGILGLP